MSARHRILPTLLASGAIVLATALAGCSSPTPAPATDSGTASDAGTTPSAAPAPAASGPDACALVTPAVIQSVLGVDPGAGTSSAGFGGTGSTTCKYASSDLIAQVSLDADTYYPATIYDKSQVSGAVDPTSGDRGYVAPGAMLVVKGKVGVFVTGSAITSIDQGQALAAALVPGM
jgi:hypothetical protein